MNTSKRKDLEGRRKVGICSGSYQCPNDNCPFLNSTPEKKRNVQNWQYLEGRRVQTLWYLGKRAKMWSQKND